MKNKLILSFLFLNIFFVAFTQDNPHKNQAALVEDKGLTKVSVMYPYAEGKTFDMAYYENKHMPMVAAFLGSNLVKYTIEKGVSSGIPNTPLPFMAIGTFYIKSFSEYQAAIAPNRDAIRKDFANYTNISPIILVSEVVK
jgi:uncharacterized protein (TIGR02118 family)